MPSRCVLAFHHVNKGGSCRGPFLEGECTGRLRRFPFRRRNPARHFEFKRPTTTPNEKLPV